MNTLKLNKLSAQNLTDRQMGKIKGGSDCIVLKTCSCGCQQANNGGSSIADNSSANCRSGLVVPKGVAVQARCQLLLCW
jgi:natural product precursor